MIIQRESLNGLLGMSEMETTVWVMCQMSADTGIPFHELVVQPDNFVNLHRGQAMVGFCQMCCNGWIVSSYPNCEFLPSKELVARMRKHGVLSADTPDPLDMVQRMERRMNQSFSAKGDK